MKGGNTYTYIHTKKKENLAREFVLDVSVTRRTITAV